MTLTNLRIAQVTFVAEATDVDGVLQPLSSLGIETVHVGVTAPAGAHLIEVRSQGRMVATANITIEQPGREVIVPIDVNISSHDVEVRIDGRNGIVFEMTPL